MRADPYCGACPRRHWEYRISREEFAGRLTEGGFPVDGDWQLEISETDESGRVAKLTVLSRGQKKVLGGNEFRRVLGDTNIRSTLFEIASPADSPETEDGLLFTGRGAGHGVGLCQWGAKGMADEGKGYREILEFYYPGAEIVKDEGIVLPPDPE